MRGTGGVFARKIRRNRVEDQVLKLRPQPTAVPVMRGRGSRTPESKTKPMEVVMAATRPDFHW